MRKTFNVLVVSGNLENKQAILNILNGLPLNVCTTPTIEQAWEMLLGKSVELILCDQNLPDGDYKDFLSAVRSEHKAIRFAVLMSSDAWDEYLEAIQLGVTDVIRYPYQPTDIELALIRVSHQIWPEEVSTACA